MFFWGDLRLEKRNLKLEIGNWSLGDYNSDHFFFFPFFVFVSGLSEYKLNWLFSITI